MTDKLKSEICEEAAEVVEAGWCQGAARVPKDDENFHAGWDHCTLGALWQAEGFYEVGFTTDSHPEIEKDLKRRVGDVPAWNDAPERKKEEVIDLLMTQAKEYRNRGE